MKTTVKVKQIKHQGRWKENLGKYLIDISKYIVTGVVIASLFQDVSDKTLIYSLGVILALSTLIDVHGFHSYRCSVHLVYSVLLDTSRQELDETKQPAVMLDTSGTFLFVQQ